MCILRRRSPWLGSLVCLCSILPVATRTVSGQQAATEETGFEAARGVNEPNARAEALQHFLQNFPAGPHHEAAENLLLDTLVNDFPERTEAIHTAAAAEVNAAPAGIDRWTEEARIANLLADADGAGTDLQDARAWAEDAVNALTEESFRRAMTAAQVRYKLPRLPAKELQAQYIGYRADFLATLANVDLRQNRAEAAGTLLAEAYRLQPLSSKINSLRGELALAQGDSNAALLSLERADAMGGLSRQWREHEVALFAKLGGGDQDALDRRVDQVSRGLYPALFSLPRRQLAPGGHTVLLELFTGSGCLPCAAPDLAMDSLLGSYTRKDLVLLAYDENIPRPDPLTAPDGVARAASYGVTATPAAFLDGQPVDVLGGSRGDVENAVLSLADPAEQLAATPSGLNLSLSATTSSTGSIQVHPHLALNPLRPTQPDQMTGDVSMRKLAGSVLYVALVQDDVRYSGENGVRFHRMVVRSVRQLPAATYLSLGERADAIVFDPAALDREQVAYLKSYQATNDRFGAFQFLTTHLPIQGGKLALAAWVQDPVTKTVLQSAFLPVPAR